MESTSLKPRPSVVERLIKGTPPRHEPEVEEAMAEYRGGVPEAVTL